jgi:hypothetical protein
LPKRREYFTELSLDAITVQSPVEELTSGRFGSLCKRSDGALIGSKAGFNRCPGPVRFVDTNPDYVQRQIATLGNGAYGRCRSRASEISVAGESQYEMAAARFDRMEHTEQQSIVHSRSLPGWLKELDRRPVWQRPHWHNLANVRIKA